MAKHPNNPFLEAATSENNDATETWTETKDQKNTVKKNPFMDALASCCIMEHIKAGLNIAKEAVTQPFGIVADVAFTTLATLESLKDLNLLETLERAFLQLCGLESQRAYALAIANKR